MADLQYSVTIDGTPYGSDTITKVQLVYDIDTHLPSGSMLINDQAGDLLAQMEFMIGSEVIIKVLSPNSGTVVFPTMVISKLFHDNKINTTEFGGYYQVFLEHSWKLSQDYTPHAYAPAKISEVVKNILADEARGKAYKDKSVNIADTDDTGKIPRYKTETSDYDFIVDTLLPMAVIKTQPAYFFYDTRGKFNFISIQELYKEQASAVLTGMDLSGTIPKFDKIVSKTLSKRAVLAKDFTILIGGGTKVPLLRGIRPKVNLDTMIGKFLSGIKSPTAMLTAASGKNSGNKLPILFTTILANKPTDEISSPNKMWDDQMAMAVNSGRRLDSMFRLECVAGPDLFNNITIGSVVQFLLPEKALKAAEDKTELKAHWLVGKWVVQQLKFEMNGKGAKTTIRCIKPNFTINTDTTSISVPDLCYSV